MKHTVRVVADEAVCIGGETVSEEVLLIKDCINR